MKFQALKVGELARRTGLTVRTLHHYDEIGLVKPTLHTDSGHRLYTGRDLARLQQVVSLRQLCFALEEIAAYLDRPGFSPLEVIALQAARLRDQIAQTAKLCERLDAIAAHLRAAGEVSAEEFLQTIKEMTMIDSYFTPEQLEQLRVRQEQSGAHRIEQVQAEWPELIAQVRAAMENGTDPAAPEVQAFAARWKSLVAAFTGGDAGIAQSAKQVWNEQGDSVAAGHGSEFDPRGVFEYIGRAMAIANR
jgi:DNA-binding transcriptional MerR regulator